MKEKDAVMVFDMKAKAWSTADMNPKGKAPKPVEGASQVLVGEDRMILFGGCTRNAPANNAVHSLVRDNDVWDWLDPMVTGNPPTARKAHAATTHKKLMLVSGGKVETVASESVLDIHVMDVNQGTSVVEWLQPEVTGTPPDARSQHAMFSDGNKVFVFGGILEEKRDEVVEAAPGMRLLCLSVCLSELLQNPYLLWLRISGLYMFIYCSFVSHECFSLLSGRGRRVCSGRGRTCSRGGGVRRGF